MSRPGRLPIRLPDPDEIRRLAEQHAATARAAAEERLRGQAGGEATPSPSPDPITNPATTVTGPTRNYDLATTLAGSATPGERATVHALLAIADAITDAAQRPPLVLAQTPGTDTAPATT